MFKGFSNGEARREDGDQSQIHGLGAAAIGCRAFDGAVVRFADVA